MSYNYYIPAVYSNDSVDPQYQRRGIGITTGHHNLEDIDTLSCSWWYAWGTPIQYLSNPKFVPMSYSGEPVAVPTGFSKYLLVFNEPDLPGDGFISPSDALSLLKKLQQKNEFAKLIVGGLSHWGTEWLQEFVSISGDWKPYGWHVHGYIDQGVTLDFLKNWWFSNVQKMCSGEIWVSEFADVTENGSQGKEYYDWIKDQLWIKRFAWFANRMNSSDSFYPSGWKFNPRLVDDLGNMTSTGVMYTTL
jgi:hypothetical protein